MVGSQEETLALGAGQHHSVMSLPFQPHKNLARQMPDLLLMQNGQRAAWQLGQLRKLLCRFALGWLGLFADRNLRVDTQRKVNLYSYNSS